MSIKPLSAFATFCAERPDHGTLKPLERRRQLEAEWRAVKESDGYAARVAAARQARHDAAAQGWEPKRRAAPKPEVVPENPKYAKPRPTTLYGSFQKLTNAELGLVANTFEDLSVAKTELWAKYKKDPAYADRMEDLKARNLEQRAAQTAEWQAKIDERDAAIAKRAADKAAKRAAKAT